MNARRKIAAVLLGLLTFVPIQVFGVGFTPTDAGLVVDFKQNDQFLLSVWIDTDGDGEEDPGEEYFVCHYPSYTGGRFKYKAGHELRLIPQTEGATVPSEASVWTIDAPLTRVKSNVDYALGGISYTMWSSSGYTLMSGTPTSTSAFKYLGCLSNNKNSSYLCDVVFVVPTVRATENMDPNSTLNASHTAERRHRGDGSVGEPTWAFDGNMRTGFAGMTYREVYWFDIPRFNTPNTYTNASLVTFNTTLSNIKCANGDFTLTPGMAGYAFADNKHKPTPRTIFRLYVLGEKEFNSCPSYFFGWDTQDYLRYRNADNMTSFSTWRKIYTLDHFECMERVFADTSFFQTRGIKVPDRDSVYYYVGYNNHYYTGDSLGSNKSKSVFTSIDSLRIRALKDQPKAYVPTKDAFGYMAIDTTSSEDNLGVAFEPAGYFLKVSTGTNVKMIPNADRTIWTSEEMWTITDAWGALTIKATLQTGPEFSETDPGADISGWSEMIVGNTVLVKSTGESCNGKSGWAQINVADPSKNGGMVFVEAEADKYIHYNNNGHFGTQIPDQHAVKDESTVTVQAPRLLGDYEFLGWNTAADGSGTSYAIGDVVDFSTVPEVEGKRVLELYAQARYKGSINVAVSFLKEDGKRYFLTHPGGAPRYARARYYNDWTNVRQGIGNADNSDPNYLTSYKIIGNEGICVECGTNEYVLDPKHETMKGARDSLTFYEDYQPNGDEYLGLYYTDPNTIIANNTWAGLFTSTKGWPTPANACVDSTRIYSTHYLHRVEGVITKSVRSNSDKPNVKYDPTTNQFDGVAAGDSTAFMISGVGVVDGYYVILPDTTDATIPWTESITFDYHTEPSMQQVWSKLIGKQLLAQMKVGGDTIYFHPNPDKTITNANELRLSQDYRLTHTFQYIYDKRSAVAGRIAEGDSVIMEETENGFCCNIYSGASSPIGDFEDDIRDTLRVWLRPAPLSKVKDYYGRWKKGAPGVHVKKDGSRYRDILVKTKTYHYGAVQTRLMLKPEHETYNFSPLASQSQTLNFTLEKQTYRQLLDAEDNVIREDIVTTKDTTTILDLTSATCTLTGGDVIFTISATTATGIRLTTKAQNTEKADRDTLNISVTIAGEAISLRVPLMQAALSGTELVWSVVDKTTGRRYFIMAGEDGLIYREFTQNSLTLYKLNDIKTKLIKGSANAKNNDARYITPWTYSFTGNNITFNTEYGVGKSFAVSGSDPYTAGVSAPESPSTLTFEIVNTYANDNANYEEQVRLSYGPTPHWLKFNGTSLEFVTNKEEASTFSWSYLLDEFNIQNNGTYPDHPSVEFGYNSTSPVTVQTAFKAYHEYSMLLDNKKVYVCRQDESSLANLTNPEKIWQLTYTVDTIRDRRDFDGSPEPLSGLNRTTTNFTSTITPSGSSPMDVTIDGKYVNIVDTLRVTVGLQGGTPPDYRFKGDWSSFTSLSDACLKIPLIRKTYHTAPYDSLVCVPEGEEYNFTFPATLPTGVGADSTHTFYLSTVYRHGTNTLDADGHVVKYVASETDNLTDEMHLGNPSLAEIRLVDEYGKKPDWCEISAIGDSTVTMKCLKNGIRSPRSATLYFAYIVDVDGSEGYDYRYANFKLTVSQPSFFQYANNQTLVHSAGASGDPLMPDGRQQTHENKRILYYYNPGNYGKVNQAVELPVRERGFYGWWRWYREGKDENDFDCSDMDILDSLWITPPRNVGKFNYPFRIIGDSVLVDPEDPSKGKKLVTMGRYTVFHYPSVQYATKVDPPAKSPQVVPPINKKTVTYVVDLGNYYDNLPLSMAHVNQIDTAVLDTMQNIIEPTLSLREVFELRPWTEMAEILEGYKDTIASSYRNMRYMEDHEVMAPIGNRLLLRTEQRYIYDNLTKKGHSESLLGYYMRDDNWSTASWSTPDEDGVSRQDTMIWCGGWDVDCMWFTYDPSTQTYTPCNHPITVDDDFLNVPAKTSLSGNSSDTVYYCLRAHSVASVFNEADLTMPPLEKPGDYWFNICRYKIMYHNPRKFGPLQETTKSGVTKALITNDEIEQNYEILERLNFDYIKPGKDYQVYPHPLPWGDGSYGYSYPVRPDIPDNRYHNDFAPNFPGVGEYGLINRIPYSNYWHKMEQHGGAENGYMIYCDGMNSSGQVAALSLETKLCEGQKMYFSAFVGNPSNQSGKANPNFTISVQGSANDTVWEDISTYMTGDIKPSNQWSQIYFPIKQKETYDHFRVRIYNMASDFDGNDFIIDDMCVFATKPPLIAYQANTKCVDDIKNDSVIHVVLRVDYQGFIDTLTYNGNNVYYTVQQTSKTNDTTFVPMIDGYLYEAIRPGKASKPDTISGHIPMPKHDYVPTGKDSIFVNLSDFVERFDTTFQRYLEEKTDTFFNMGYLYENLDGIIRPVLYVIHNAKMTADNTYTVRLSAENEGLMSSKCAMTSDLKVTNRMILMLDNEEKEDPNVTKLCANATYDLSVRVKGSLFLDSIAPLDVNGSCTNDWLLYGDTSDVSSLARYGYKYSDIKKVIKDILRCEAKTVTNVNQFARSLTEVNHNNMLNVQKNEHVRINDTEEPPPGSHYDPYVILSHLVNNGFLTLYQSQMTATVAMGDSLQYVIFPILGTGSEDIYKNNMEVCPTPMVIKLKPSNGGGIPLIVGGIKRDSTQMNLPVVVLMNERTANNQFSLYIDSIMTTAALHSVTLMSTNDPDYYAGVHRLNLEPDRVYNFGGDNSGYYVNGQDIVLRPSPSNNYQMRQGYHYTFAILMQSLTGSLTDNDGCPVGTVPFTLGIVPDYLRWAPQSPDNNQWNNPDNWIGVDANNDTIPNIGRFAPLPVTDVIIMEVPEGMPYPHLPDPGAISPQDSVKQVGFSYNICDDIRFMQGAAISQQQRLTCDVVVADMTMPFDKWAFRSAPLTGLISGDLFMANTDLSGETKYWSVGTFDANGRNYNTGNASFWLSVYSRETRRINHNAEDSVRTADADWSRVTNAMTLPLMPAQGWAVYSLTAAENDAVVRLPKNDDIYYYFGTYGEQINDRYESNLLALRDTLDKRAGGSGEAGKLAFTRDAQAYRIHNDNPGGSSSFVFGNPTMGYIDIWGFIADNSLKEEFHYMDESLGASVYTQVTKDAADETSNTINNRWRYLPPMRAIVVMKADESAAANLDITLNANRVVTDAGAIVRPPAPRHKSISSIEGRSGGVPPINKGIMTITAINPVSPICTSRLLLGQGYHPEVREGEDAVLTTICIDDFSMVNAPATPFNIYAAEGNKGLSIDLRDSIVNVPVSFYISDLPYDQTTRLWFTGVNNIEEPLEFYDAVLDFSRNIVDGIYIDIETPQESHLKRYYIRRRGYKLGNNSEIPTGLEHIGADNEQAIKIVHNGQVFILRNGHVYTMFGQKVR